MSDFVSRALRCPVCSTEFGVDVLLPGRVVGRDTDFRPRFEGPDPFATAIDICPQCRFAAYPDSFGWAGDDDDENPARHTVTGRKLPPLPGLDDEAIEDLRGWIRSGELTRGHDFSRREPLPQEKFLLAVRCYDFLKDDDNLASADYLLKAAWCARAQNDARAEERFLREAITRFGTAIEERQVPDPDRARVTYLVAELSRRAGDFPRAVDLYGRVSEIADPDDREGRLLCSLARRQVALATVKSSVNAVIHEEAEVPPDDDAETP